MFKKISLLIAVTALSVYCLCVPVLAVEVINTHLDDNHINLSETPEASEDLALTPSETSTEPDSSLSREPSIPSTGKTFEPYYSDIKASIPPTGKTFKPYYSDIKEAIPPTGKTFEPYYHNYQI